MGGSFVINQPATSSALNSSPVRTNLDALFAGDLQPLRVTAQGTPDMTVAVAGDNDRGYVLGNVAIDYAGGNSGTFTAPAGAGEKRIDILSLDSAGSLTITTGTVTTGTPSPPTYPQDELPLAEIYLRQGMTVIKDADDSTNGYVFKDRSPLFNLGAALSDVVPLALGTAAAGVATAVARDDHIHAFALPVFTAGDLIVGSSNEEGTLSDTTLVKKKEFVLAAGGTLRIKFDMRVDASATPAHDGRIYRNGAAVGTLHTASSTTYVTYSEDIAGWSAGDLCQLYVRVHVSATQYYRNLRLYSGSRFQNVSILD